MVAPTGTKPSTSKYQYDPRWGYWPIFWEYKRRRWQAPPYNLILPYEMISSTYSQNRWEQYYGSGLSYGAESVYSATYPSASSFVRANNASYEKLKGKIYTSAQLGVTFAETSQALAMMGNAARSILMSMKNVKQLKFRAAAQSLGMNYVPAGISKKKQWADNWLEYHFGWAPFMQTVYDTAEVINNPYKRLEKAKGVGKDYEQWQHRYNAGSVFGGYNVSTEVISYQGASIRAIRDSTLHTLDQFGLLNPAVVAWELIPFSFVIDWFANVGDVLQSYSDFAGMELVDTYTTNIVRGNITGFTGLTPGWPGTPGWTGLRYNGRCVSMSRVNGLTSPALALKHLTLPSKERAFTAIALVTQFATKGKPSISRDPGSYGRDG